MHQYRNLWLLEPAGRVAITTVKDFLKKHELKVIFVCYEDYFLLHNQKYATDWKIKEYRELYDNLLLDTSLKENPKVFRKLAQQYHNYFNGYYG